MIQIKFFDKYNNIFRILFQMLYLNFNNLLEIPSQIFVVLKKLKWLDLRNNQLKKMPITIKCHPSLETLLLQNNKIIELPSELGVPLIVIFITGQIIINLLFKSCFQA